MASYSILSNVSDKNLEIIKMTAFSKLFHDNVTCLDLIEFFNNIKIVVPYNRSEWSCDYDTRKTSKIAEFSTNLKDFIRWSYKAPYDFEYSIDDGFDTGREVFDQEEFAIEHKFKRVDEEYEFEDLCVKALVDLSDIYEGKFEERKYLLLTDHIFFNKYNREHFKSVTNIDTLDSVYITFKNGTTYLEDNVVGIDRNQESDYIDIRIGSFEKLRVKKSENAFLAKATLLNKDYDTNNWSEDSRHILSNIRVIENY